MALEVFYEVSLLIDLAVMNTVVFWKREYKERKIVKALRKLMVVLSFTVLTSLLSGRLDNQNLSLFIQTVHFVMTEWMLILLVCFLDAYVGGVRRTKQIVLILRIYASICSASLLANCVFHHVVTSERLLVNGISLNIFHTKSPAYDFHLYFCLSMVLYSIIILGIGTGRTTKLYRKKYFIALLMLVFTVIMDGLCMILTFQHDFSLHGYCALGLFFAFYVLYYKPKGVITRMLSYLVEGSHNRVMCFDPEDKCIYINEEARNFYGHEVSSERYEEKCKELLQVDSFRHTEDKKWLSHRIVNGEDMYFEYNFVRMYDEKQNYIGCYFSVYDNTEDVKKYNRQKYLATHDSLTGVYNKDYFFERVLQYIKIKTDKKYYIVYMDVKDFKLINDLFGYEKGNEILIKFAASLRESIAEDRGMFCARLHSDRFALCIPKDYFVEDYLMACIKNVQTIFKTSEFQLCIHAGVYEIRPEDDDVSVMCDRANVAVQTIKNDYDKLIAYYDDNLMNKMVNRNYMLNEFDKALEEHQFVMFLQPQVDTDGRVLGAEALTRWIHPKQGMISPGEFIPVFEESGLIHIMDQYIWEQAARKLKEWKDNGREDLYISVNISTKDFYYVDVHKAFTQLVEKYGISPDKLKLEITETALMQDMDKQIELLLRLQTYGFHVEIDDFGSGYSSLNMLKNIRADVLKIDMGFLQEIKDYERTKVILAMVVELAKRLKMTVITEGVENKEQVDYLRHVGCDMFQGFYFERPIPVEDFETNYMK